MQGGYGGRGRSFHGEFRNVLSCVQVDTHREFAMQLFLEIDDRACSNFASGKQASPF